MRLTVLGGDGGFPDAGGACSGYLLETDGFHLLVDPGYATFPRLARQLAPERVDAVIVSHGHPDHCADLSPLLRARSLREDPLPPLPVYSLPGAVAAVLALDSPRTASTVELHDFSAGTEFRVGPLQVRSFDLPHFVPNAGLRVKAGEEVLAYTGDSGPSPQLRGLAQDADLLLAEATYVSEVPAEDAPFLSSARQAGQLAHAAHARRLLLTHVWPGTDRDELEHAAREGFNGQVGSATAGETIDLRRHLGGHQGF